MAQPKGTIPPATKTNRITKRERVAVVLEMLVGGVPAGKIQTELSKRWSVRQRTIRAYMTHCRQTILPSWYEWADQRAICAELIAKLDRVYAKAVIAGDHVGAVRALRQQAEMYGVNSARMIAKERDSLAMQLAELRKGTGEGEITSDGNAPMDQANAVRQLYGQRRFASVDEYRDWVAALAPQTGSNGSNGAGN